MKKDKFLRYDINQLRSAIEKSLCWSDVCRQLDVTICTFNNRRLQKLCNDYEISTEHFNLKKTFRRNKKEPWTEKDILVEDSKIHRQNLRKVLIRFGLYTGLCSECKIGEEWNGKKLTLEIDHINGKCNDNRRENLRWLCPNCHSQTPTFKRSNIRRKE